MCSGAESAWRTGRGSGGRAECRLNRGHRCRLARRRAQTTDDEGAAIRDGLGEAAIDTQFDPSRHPDLEAQAAGRSQPA